MASILDGKYVAALHEQRMTALLKHHATQRPPGLAVILVGDDPASHVYVQHKKNACLRYGFHSECDLLPEDTTEEILLARIAQLNEAPHIDGILVQLPLPAHIQTDRIIHAISPDKDVDGFHPENLGRLAQGRPFLRPCTPYGIITLLKHYEISLKGIKALVVGASRIVGRPMMLELLNEKSTVTIAHRETKDLKTEVLHHTLIIVATGVQDVIDPTWFLPHHIVVDVGIHRLDQGSLRGDVDFQRVRDRVAKITPVPFGVGPMTIAMLLENTWIAYLKAMNLSLEKTRI